MRYNPKEIILEKMRKFNTLCRITNVDAAVVNEALQSSFLDFENALQYYSAINAGATTIVTRNKKDYQLSVLPVFTPDEYLNL